MDATFLIAMVRITTTTTTTTTTTSNDGTPNDNSNHSNSSSTIVSRIERVLQVNGSTSHGGNSSRDDRIANFNSNYDTTSDSNPHHHNNNYHGSYNHFNVRFFIPQEAVDELETIIQTFKDRAEATKKQKKKNQYQAKSKVFEDALDWIKRNSRNSRCEILPGLEPIAQATKQHKSKNPHQSKEATAAVDGDDEASSDAETSIAASDAMRRHIARDDGRESKTNDNTQNDKVSKHFSRTYIVASQEEDLLGDLRVLGTVPILRCTNNASVLILENASKKGQRTDHVKETTKWKCSLQNPAEKALVDAAWKAQKANRKNNNVLGGSSSESTRVTAKKARGPNPLSCKKRKRDGPDNQGKAENVSKSKKRRQRAQRQKTTSATSNTEVEEQQ